MKSALCDVKCPNCQRIYKLGGDLIGQKVRCRCGHVFRLADEHMLGEAKSPQSVVTAPTADASYLLDEPPPGSGESGHEAAADDDLHRVQSLKVAYENITLQLSRVIVGQHRVIEEVLIAIFCRGHVLLVGVPGVAKTLLVSTLARALRLGFKRIQFTPDLMPSDITGTDVLEEDHTTGKRVFRFVEGPLFTNMVLADEINRTPPKTQAALLESMQERHVTVGEGTYLLPAPFFVLATQNPIEQEGTYPLPEAQLDRFLFNTIVHYPKAEEEFTIIKQVTSDYRPDVHPTLDAEDVVRLQEVVLRVPAADHVVAFARDIARATRPKEPGAPKFVKEMVSWGAGPRAGISLVMAAKARAILYGRYHATTEDVKAVCLPVLRHRVVTTFNAEAAGVTSDQIVQMILDHVPAYKG
jgi:MoxR-like ATPase